MCTFDLPMLQAMSDSEEEETMVELAEWAQIQKKTFTRWCNQQLKSRSLEIDDLQVGLKDGVSLVNLVELLTKKSSNTRYNKKPRIKMQMVENIGIGLKILTDDGIKLVNIGNEDIYAGNMKLILGLIWTLILRYQISVDFQEDSGNNEVSAKKQLMNWASELINNLPESGKSVKNFTTDWNDGIALCSMVEAVAPGLCPEFNSLDPDDRLGNAKLGLDRAELGLGVPKIIEAEDLINPNIDELSVLTYVSLLKNAIPTIDLKPVDPLKIKIFGPGTETAMIDTPTHFLIDTSGAGFGRLLVVAKDCLGNELPIELWKKGDETKVLYSPVETGPLQFHVTYNKENVPNGDFTVKVLSPCDSSKVNLSGDGLKTAFVNKPTNFTVDAGGTGEGDLEVTIVGPSGKLPVDISKDGLQYTVEYTPDTVGPVLVTVKFAGAEVPDCPFHVEVVNDIDPFKVKILAKGLENPLVGQPLKFVVCTAGAGNGDLKVSVADEDGNPLKVTIGDIDSDNKEVKFSPENPGSHHVTVTWSDMPVPGGEVDVEVMEPLHLEACIIDSLNANPVVGHPTSFTIDCSKVGSNDLGVTAIDSSGKALEVTIEDIGHDQFKATFVPDSVVPLRIAVKIADRNVTNSPMSVNPIDPLKVVIAFDTDKDWMVGEPVEIAVSMTSAGPGQLGINLSAPPGSGTDCNVKEVAPGQMAVVFTPLAPGDHLVNLTFNDSAIPASPVVIRVVVKPDAKSVVVDGDGIKEGHVGKTAVFTVNISDAGPGDLDIKVRGPKNTVECHTMEIGEGLYEVTYTPSEEGPHVVAVKFADQHVPGSAFRPLVTKSTSAGDVVAYGKGLEEGVPGTDNEFYVDTSKAGEGDLVVSILAPDGTPLTHETTNLSPTHLKVTYPVPMDGNYSVNITWSDVHIPKSPFNINVRTPFNPSSVLANGPGLMYGIVGKLSLFEVDCRAAGNGPLNINVEDDSHNLIPVKVSETQPNCYDVSFIPATAIPHHVSVNWNEFNVKGSPFKVEVMPRPENDINLGGEGKIRVYYSTTTSSEKIRHSCRFLQTLLERKKVHLREDFEPWIPIDIGMDREERNRIFEKANVRKTPMLFIDDQYVGDYDDVTELDEIGELDRLLSYCALKYRNLKTVEEARKADELLRMQQESSED